MRTFRHFFHGLPIAILLTAQPATAQTPTVANPYATKSESNLASMRWWRSRATLARCAFSADGKRMVTGINDHTARVWDTASSHVFTR